MLPSCGRLTSPQNSFSFQVCLENKRHPIFFNWFSICLSAGDLFQSFLSEKKLWKQWKIANTQKYRKKHLVYGSCPVNKFGLYNFIVYGAELSPEFLERRSVFGVVLPAVVHNPGDFHWAAVWSRHAVSWNTSQTFNISAETCLAYLFETSGIQKRF